MLHISNVATDAAGETSVRATRPREMQTVPRGEYDFGEGDIMGGRVCVTIQPMPIARSVKVISAAVMPDSLPGGALPSDSVVMPTGEMYGLGASVMPVPVAFRHGVAPADRRALVGQREVRRIGRSLVPTAQMAPDMRQSHLTPDRRYLNRSGGPAVHRNDTLAPDDRLRRRLIAPTIPGDKVSRPTALTVVRERERANATVRDDRRYTAYRQPERAATTTTPQRYTAYRQPEASAMAHPAGCTCPIHGLGITPLVVRLAPIPYQLTPTAFVLAPSSQADCPAGSLFSPAGGGAPASCYNPNNVRCVDGTMVAEGILCTGHGGVFRAIIPGTLFPGGGGGGGGTPAPQCPPGATYDAAGNSCVCDANTQPNADGSACVATSGGDGDADREVTGGTNWPLIGIGLLALAGGVYWVSKR